MAVTIWCLFVFVLGACVGSFLNVCIYRIPLEKSVLWPGSRCGTCFQTIRSRDNIPILSYLLLRGRCRTCGASFSARYLLVELMTGLGFVGIFYLEVIRNIHGWEILEQRRFDLDWGIIPYAGWVLFGFHATLFSLLLIVSMCDLDRREIPLSVTFAGTFLGLVGSMLWPWPWPYTPDEALQPVKSAHKANQAKFEIQTPEWWLLDPADGPKPGLYPWPVWGPLDFLKSGDTWAVGLVTSLAGMLAGTLLLRAIRFLFSTGLGIEALGLGDADLMMMAGAFLGWQPVVVAFFVSVFPALIIGIVLLITKRDNALPFGPSLAFGVVLTWLGWDRIAPHVQPIFFWREMLLGMAIFGGVFMFLAGHILRRLRR